MTIKRSSERTVFLEPICIFFIIFLHRHFKCLQQRVLNQHTVQTISNSFVIQIKVQNCVLLWGNKVLLPWHIQDESKMIVQYKIIDFIIDYSFIQQLLWLVHPTRSLFIKLSWNHIDFWLLQKHVSLLHNLRAHSRSSKIYMLSLKIHFFMDFYFRSQTVVVYSLLCLPRNCPFNEMRVLCSQCIICFYGWKSSDKWKQLA